MRRSIRVCTATALLLIASVQYAQSMPVGYPSSDDVFAASAPTVAPNSSRQRQFALYSLLLAMFGDALGYPPQMIAPPTLAAAITHPAYPTGYLTGYPGADYPAYGQQASQYVPGSYGPAYSQIGAPFGGMAGDHYPPAFVQNYYPADTASSTDSDAMATDVDDYSSADPVDAMAEQNSDAVPDVASDMFNGAYSGDAADYADSVAVRNGQESDSTSDATLEATLDDDYSDNADVEEPELPIEEEPEEEDGDGFFGDDIAANIAEEGGADAVATKSDIEEETEANAEEDEDDDEVGGEVDDEVPQLEPEFGGDAGIEDSEFDGDAANDNNDSAVGDDAGYPAGYVQVCDKFSCKLVRKPKSPVSA